MVLIIGGVYQGKLDYAISNLGISHKDVHFCSEDNAALPNGHKVVNDFEKWILALVRQNEDVAHHVREFTYNNNDTIVIVNDISCGVVPMDTIMRKWREEASRAAGKVANASTEVVRLYCGIATRLKP